MAEKYFKESLAWARLISAFLRKKLTYASLREALKVVVCPVCGSVGEPESGDFRDGWKAEGCWIEAGEGAPLHYQQVAGNSGVYLIVTDLISHQVIRDDRPWQMKEGVS